VGLQPRAHTGLQARVHVGLQARVRRVAGACTWGCRPLLHGRQKEAHRAEACGSGALVGACVPRLVEQVAAVAQRRDAARAQRLRNALVAVGAPRFVSRVVVHGARAALAGQPEQRSSAVAALVVRRAQHERRVERVAQRVLQLQDRVMQPVGGGTLHGPAALLLL